MLSSQNNSNPVPPNQARPVCTSFPPLLPTHYIRQGKVKKKTHVPNTVTIVVLSRLAYRKGIDLLVGTAPRICAAFPNVRFVVGELSAYTFKHTTIGNLSLPEQEATVQN